MRNEENRLLMGFSWGFSGIHGIEQSLFRLLSLSTHHDLSFAKNSDTLGSIIKKFVKTGSVFQGRWNFPEISRIFEISLKVINF